MVQSDNASFSQSNVQESDTAAQKLAQGNRHSIHRVSSQVHDFYSLPKPSQYSGFDLPRSLASPSHTKADFSVSASDSEDMYTFKEPRNTPCSEFGDLPVDSAIAPPPLPPKTPWGSSPQQRPPDSDYKYPTRDGETACWCDKSPKKTIVGLPHNASSDDSYVSINPGSDIPMSTMPLHIASRGSEIQPPPVYRHLKPGRKAKPEPLDLRDNTVINELPFKSPVTKPWSTGNNTFNPSSSQYCHSISITDSGDCEENYVPMQNLTSSSPLPSGTNNPAPKKSTGNVNYIDPDFQKPSPSPQHKPSTSSLISDKKGVYVQIDEEKNQALQKTIQESTKMRQS
ncbi:GRB2-associated-binding protein 2-like [Cricetulus griseus]|uniref:GRB2-associated-binding protein 2-like n=1 Tax=Cricetulus griseus TaxID=10029 RepID=A0A9J7KCR1_CRIGR|nr:GRB2-associated-binding protein 2-like [Cricetulus griseus]